jgi:hypothetical protein
MAAAPAPALASVEAMADWLLALLDAAGVKQAAAVRSQHGIADRAGGFAPRRRARQHLAMIGTTYPMKVSDACSTARAATNKARSTWSTSGRIRRSRKSRPFPALASTRWADRGG